jgi:3-hydroxybutyryl-CoA dehydrogenase
VTSLGNAIGEPHRTIGMHFFNPAPLMKLVEVIAGDRTDPQVVDRTAEIAEGWGKVVARAADVPGFIVNHVARPYYLEAFRIMEDGFAGPDEIDEAMRLLGGFRMGPLELTDLIGQDVNTATTRSVWEALDHPPLLHPSRLQEQLVAQGHLGRKTGRGVYSYEGDAPVAAITIQRAELKMSDELRQIVEQFNAAATDATGNVLQQYVFARVLVAIIAQAALANDRGVATPQDIDTALRYGTNYPQGPFEGAARIGYVRCTQLLEALNKTVPDNRFALPTMLGGRRRTATADS